MFNPMNRGWPLRGGSWMTENKRVKVQVARGYWQVCSAGFAFSPCGFFPRQMPKPSPTCHGGALLRNGEGLEFLHLERPNAAALYQGMALEVAEKVLWRAPK